MGGAEEERSDEPSVPWDSAADIQLQARRWLECTLIVALRDDYLA